MGLSSAGPHAESAVRLLYDTYRAPPRELALYGNKPETFRMLVEEQVENMDFNAMRNALWSTAFCQSSHLIMCIEPSDSRFKPSKTIASPFAFKLLWDRHLRAQVSETAHFYDLVSEGGPGTASCAGWIFEFQMHQLLRQGYLMSLFPISRTRSTSTKFDVYNDYTNSHNERDAEHFQLAALQEEALDEGIELKVNHYYRPMATNFSTINSVFLIHPANSLPILLMFQITWRKDEYDAKDGGLNQVDGLRIPPGTRKYLVVVTPSGGEPKIQSPKGRFENEHVLVYHHPVQRRTLFPRT